MLVSTPNRFRHALEKLAAEPPSTKTALIRSLLSEIEAALASGKTWKQVWQCLADDGLDISYETFRKALQRIRKKARISAPLRGKSLELPGLRSEEHTSELQSLTNLVCRLLLEKKKKETKL